MRFGLGVHLSSFHFGRNLNIQIFEHLNFQNFRHLNEKPMLDSLVSDGMICISVMSSLSESDYYASRRTVRARASWHFLDNLKRESCSVELGSQKSYLGLNDCWIGSFMIAVNID